MNLLSRLLTHAASFVVCSALILITTITFTVTEVATAADYFVATDGSDTNPGTLEQPFQSIERAQAQVRKDAARGKQPITVYLRGGTYYLKRPLIFTHEDSGTQDAPVSYAAYKSEKVVVSGGRALELSWKPYRDGIVQADTSRGLKFDQLFANGERQHMARYPNYDPQVTPYNGFSADAFSPQRAARWADPVGGFIHAMHQHHWGGYHYLITGKQADDTVTYEGGWQNNRQMGMHSSYRYVENVFEELDAPGEWFHDRKTNVLYYFPAAGIDVKTCNFEVAQLPHLVEFQGSREQPAQFIELVGLIFRHTARTFMETKEPLLRSDWTVYRGGAVTFNGAEDCVIADCEFDQVGGNAVFVNNFNRRIAVRGTHIHGAGASGVSFVGNPASVRNPLFEYHQTQSYSEIDKTAGPKGIDFPSECVVEDSLIHDIGVVEKQAAGVQISMSSGITVRHCSIYDVRRAGINISEGTFGGHLIEFCDVFDTVRETGDHGSFNSWGRDRFWNLKDAPADELPKLASLDARRSTIRNSRWRCDRGWDVDLDDGSSNYEIYNNLFLHGGLKLREGFHRHVYNNIAVNNSLHPHVWYENSGDVVTGNIWMTQYRPVRITKWGQEVDRNLFIAEEDRQAFAAEGCDQHSVVGDPMFIDPAHGDYRVKPESPAIQIGFKNFPMDEFGVQKPELKAIAQVPVFPTPELKAKEPARTQANGTTWWGASVSALSGEEYSAFGVSKETGGIQLITVPPESKAAKSGLLPADVIQRVNNQATRTVAELLDVTRHSAGNSITIELVRQQKELSLTADWARAENAPTPPRDNRMDWWRDARFGMFVHWGLYSGLAGEWKGKSLGSEGGMEWAQQRAKVDTDDYATEAIPLFQPKENFAKEWARLARLAGCKYLVFTTKHHDGFALHDSKVSEFDAGSVLQRDLVDEIVNACRAEGVKVGFYHSVIDWHHDQFDYATSKSIPHPLRGQPYPNGERDQRKYIEYLHGQVDELVSNYGPIDILWWDYSVPDFEGEAAWDASRLIEQVKQRQPQVIMNNRLFKKSGAGWSGLEKGQQNASLETRFGDFMTPEQHVPDTGIPGIDWETCMTMNTTWGYSKFDHQWKSTRTLIETLIEVVSKGGNFLLNIGPMADGTVPDESVSRLQAIGRWLEVNGEAIYGASSSPVTKPSWGRLTAISEAGLLYLHVLEWPRDGTLQLTGLTGQVQAAQLLGDNREIAFEQKDGLLQVRLPEQPASELPSVIRIQFDK
jgi:alpha-L-fucosidase